jgi:hypothetical protein
MAMPGVKDVLDASDVPGNNVIGFAGENVFAPIGTTLSHNGEVVGFVLADTQAHANAGAKAVRIMCDDIVTTNSATGFGLALSAQEGAAAGNFFSENEIQKTWGLLRATVRQQIGALNSGGGRGGGGGNIYIYLPCNFYFDIYPPTFVYISLQPWAGKLGLDPRCPRALQTGSRAVKSTTEIEGFVSTPGQKVINAPPLPHLILYTHSCLIL